MSIRVFSAAAFAAAASFTLVTLLAGCGVTDTQAYKSSRRFYYSYVNTPAKLDLSDPSTLSEADSRLVTRIAGLDQQLTNLERAMDGMSQPPDSATAQSFAQRFPWLSGMVLIDPQGAPLAGTQMMKQLDFQPLLEVAPDAKVRDLRAHIQDNPLGPEVMLARPFLTGENLKFLFVVTFDFRALLRYAQTREDLLVRTADLVLWGGENISTLDSVPWAEVLHKRSYGRERDGNRVDTWIARYLCDIPIVFATPATDAE